MLQLCEMLQKLKRSVTDAQTIRQVEVAESERKVLDAATAQAVVGVGQVYKKNYQKNKTKKQWYQKNLIVPLWQNQKYFCT